MPVLTEQNITKLCDSIRPYSKLEIERIEATEITEKITRILEQLKQNGKAPQDAHLISGIHEYELNGNQDLDILTLKEIPGLYPNKNYGQYSIFFNPMTGVLVHCYDSSTNTYAMQIRGEGVPHSNKVQIAAAGFGKYNEAPHIAAKRELEEEQGKEGSLLLPTDGTFLDVTPFIVKGYPQLLFSYISEAILSDIPIIETTEQIMDLLEKPVEGEVAHSFTVPLEKLEEIADELDNENKFFGPMHKTIKSFLNWI